MILKNRSKYYDIDENEMIQAMIDMKRENEEDEEDETV